MYTQLLERLVPWLRCVGQRQDQHQLHILVENVGWLKCCWREQHRCVQIQLTLLQFLLLIVIKNSICTKKYLLPCFLTISLNYIFKLFYFFGHPHSYFPLPLKKMVKAILLKGIIESQSILDINVEPTQIYCAPDQPLCFVSTQGIITL